MSVSGPGRSNFLTDLLSPFAGTNYAEPEKDNVSRKPDSIFSSWRRGSTQSTPFKDDLRIDSSLDEKLLTTQPQSSESRNVTRAPNSMQQNWRDRYVMRFSGWNASTPDKGLAPSLTAPVTDQTRAIKGQVSFKSPDDIGEANGTGDSNHNLISLSNDRRSLSADEEVGNPIHK